MNDLSQLTEYLPLLVPLILIEVTLKIFALIHVFKHDRYRFGNRPLWVILVVAVSLIGSVVYFVFGREEEA